MMIDLIPYSAEERTIQLPLGIDFTKPGQVDPFSMKEIRERHSQGNLDMLGQLGGLAQQQQNTQFNSVLDNAQLQARGNSLAGGLGSWPFGGLGR